jgi:uncharacterized protein YprB with RNaseH-like and TPR domain
MIRRRFSIFSGVGPNYERLIWQAGFRDWQAFLAAKEIPGLPAKTYISVSRQIQQWTEALQNRNAEFFAKNLAAAEHWQLYQVFGDSVRYLDIETTGLYPGYNQVTLVGIFDGKNYEALIAGKNLTSRTLLKALRDCELLVTYYGRVFDVPFLSKAFPTVDWNIPNFDLCFAGRRIGLKGGLKAVERSLGIERPREIEHVDGFEAVRLWYRYTGGDNKALDRLIDYNEADTTNLARIAHIVYEGLCERCQA